MALEVRPITLREARRFVGEHHRHALPPQGWLFGAGAYDCNRLVGVAIAGRPVARALDDGRTIEVTRVATDGTRNACSALYGAVCRAAGALGYRQAITYTRGDEPGSSVRAAGFELDVSLEPRPGWRYTGQARAELDLFGERRHDQEVERTRWRRRLAP